MKAISFNFYYPTYSGNVKIINLQASVKLYGRYPHSLFDVSFKVIQVSCFIGFYFRLSFSVGTDQSPSSHGSLLVGSSRTRRVALPFVPARLSAFSAEIATLYSR